MTLTREEVEARIAQVTAHLLEEPSSSVRLLLDFYLNILEDMDREQARSADLDT